MKVSAIIPAAGDGRRMGGVKKPYIDLAGRSLLVRTLSVFQQCPLINEIILVVAKGDEQRCVRDAIIPHALDKARHVIAGGSTRQESVFNGLRELSSDTGIVVVHDCARPFVTQGIITNTVRAAEKWGAATAAIPVKNTIKRSDSESFIAETLDRKQLWSIQTPQAFRYDILLLAHHKAIEDGTHATDDAALVERLDHRVRLVMGASENVKITTPGDLIIARAIVESRERIKET